MNIKATDIDVWSHGEASPEVAAAIREALQQPDSPVSQYVEWLRDSHRFLLEHGRLPDLVEEELAALPPEIVEALAHIADDLPPEMGQELEQSGDSIQSRFVAGEAIGENEIRESKADKPAAVEDSEGFCITLNENIESSKDDTEKSDFSNFIVMTTISLIISYVIVWLIYKATGH